MSMPFAVPWKRILKFAGIAAIIIFLLFGVASWLVFHQRNTLLLQQLGAFLDKSQSGQFTLGSVNLRFFRDFPALSLELDSVRYFERRDSLRDEEKMRRPYFRRSVFM